MTTRYINSGSIRELSTGRNYCTPDVSGMPVSGVYTYVDVIGLNSLGEKIFIAYPVRDTKHYVAFYVNEVLSEWL